MNRKIIAAVVGVPVTVLVSAIVIATLSFSSKQVHVDEVPIDVNPIRAADRLSQLLSFETVSTADFADRDHIAFVAQRAWITVTYPTLHETLEVEAIGRAGLLYTWRGSDPTLAPIVLAAHLDVVPADDGVASDPWQHPPFAGQQADGFVWGRGAQDDKGSALAILEAVEGLVVAREKPKRTILIALGEDEEVFGDEGAEKIAAALRRDGVQPLFTLDEGMTVLDGVIDGVDPPVAVIGIAEKGYVSLELSARSEGGHSSMPPPITAAGRVAAAVTRLQEQPFPARLEGPARAMFEHLGPEMNQPERTVMANLWLLSPVLERVLTKKNTTNALLRTTTAPTMLEGSPKDNVLPQRATAVVNFRILPGDTIESVEERVRGIVADDAIAIRVQPGATNPSPVSPTDGEAWTALSRVIRGVFPEAVVAPGLVVGATDGRHYADLGPVYRFAPFVVTPEDIPRFHGTDERISVDGLASAIVFYRQLISETSL